MLGLAADREILRIHLQRRLFVAGAYAARPRHPGRLWPAEVGDRKIVGARAAGVARDGDDGLICDNGRFVIASEAKQSRLIVGIWIASSWSLLSGAHLARPVGSSQ